MLKKLLSGQYTKLIKAHIIPEDFFTDLKDGEKAIWEMNALGKHDFSFVLGKIEGDLSGRAMLDPHPEEWFLIRYIRFYLYGYILYIKAEQTETPKEFAVIKKAVETEQAN